MDWKEGVEVWIQCTPQGDPIFMTTAYNKFSSRWLARAMLYSDEMSMNWGDIVKRDGIVERKFLVREID